MVARPPLRQRDTVRLDRAHVHHTLNMTKAFAKTAVTATPCALTASHAKSTAAPWVIDIYTDGACKGNPGPGGWGVYLQGRREMHSLERELYGGETSTTNNRMELRAVIEALQALRSGSHVRFYLDSEYVRKGITEWMPNWKRRGWKTADKKPVKNVDLWRSLDALLSNSPHTFEWHWVKGHAGNPGNERADALANQGVIKA